MPLGKGSYAKDERRESCPERPLQAQPQGKPDNSLRIHWRHQGKPKQPFRVLSSHWTEPGQSFRALWNIWGELETVTARNLN